MEFVPILLEVNCNACLLWTQDFHRREGNVPKPTNLPNIREVRMATAHPIFEVSVQ